MSDKPVTLILLLWSHKCDFGAEPRSRIIATSAVKGLMNLRHSWNFRQKFAKITILGKNVVLWVHFHPASTVKVK
jgi:hypothetical protein